MPRESESVRLSGSRLANLGAVDNHAPLLLGTRHALPPPGSAGASAGASRHAPSLDALQDVALWSRALLPEHVASLARDGLPPPRPRRPRPRAAAHQNTLAGRAAAAAAARTAGEPSRAPVQQLLRRTAAAGWAAPSAALLLVLVAAALGAACRRRREREGFVFDTRSRSQHYAEVRRSEVR